MWGRTQLSQRCNAISEVARPHVPTRCLRRLDLRRCPIPVKELAILKHCMDGHRQFAVCRKSLFTALDDGGSDALRKSSAIQL
jgi:hypothetical protein